MISKFKDNKSFHRLSRYVVAGGLTTLVNFLVFGILNSLAKIDPNLANTISVFCAVTFAYVINKLFVFRNHCESLSALRTEAVSFYLARAVTMVIEIGGVFFFTTALKYDALWSKIFLNVVVLILNYVFSKWFVFKQKPIKRP